MTKQFRVVKVCIGDWEHASRDERELSAYIECGATVQVIAKLSPQHPDVNDEVDGFSVHRLTARPLKKCPNWLNRPLSLLTWAHYIRKIPCEAISGHNIEGLFIGWLSRIGKLGKPYLIYDAHEFELGRNLDKNKLYRWAVRSLEKFLMERSAYSIMVGDRIATETASTYGLPQKPIVVRNVPEYQTLDESKVDSNRKTIFSEMNWPMDSVVMMYHGSVSASRRLDVLLRTVSRNPKLKAVVIGDYISRDYQNEIENLVTELGIGKRFYYHSAIDHKELFEYIAIADIGFVALTPHIKNHQYALPNKFFENIQAETPVITPAFPELEALVYNYHIGRSVDMDKDEDIDQAIVEILSDQTISGYIKKAKKDLCWEEEKKNLQNAFRKLMDAGN